MQRLTSNDLDALEAAHNDATPGEWVAEYGYVGDKRKKFLKRNKDQDGDRLRELGYDDVDFIALAHNALPALIAELRELRRLTTPEPISEKHRDGNWWLVWAPGAEHWFKVRWRPVGDWQRSGTTQHLHNIPTHALPLPGGPEPPAARGEE
jgi:hypothetical protein